MKKIIFLVILMFLFGCAKEMENKVSVTNSDNEKFDFQVELATNSFQHAKGLMFRKNLDEDKGMLFIFNKARTRSFWMMNTSVPLDIVFIDENMTIINIEEADPCGLIPCRMYRSEKPALYVLEINRGLSEKYDIKAGDKVGLDLDEGSN